MCERQGVHESGERGPSIFLLSQDGWLMEGKHNSIAGPRGALVENANLCSFGHSRLKEGGGAGPGQTEYVLSRLSRIWLLSVPEHLTGLGILFDKPA